MNKHTTAAREIHLLVHKSVRFIEHPEDPELLLKLCAVTIDVTSEDIEAIIVKHCLEGKAAGLVDIAERLVAWARTCPAISKSMMDILKDARIALSEYEAKNE